MADASALIAVIKGKRVSIKMAAAIASSWMRVVNNGEVVSHFVHVGMLERGWSECVDDSSDCLSGIPQPSRHGEAIPARSSQYTLLLAIMIMIGIQPYRNEGFYAKGNL